VEPEAEQVEEAPVVVQAVVQVVVGKAEVEQAEEVAEEESHNTNTLKNLHQTDNKVANYMSKAEQSGHY
jgi:hypothetical protein